MAPQLAQSLTLSPRLRAIQHSTCTSCLRALVGVQRRGITHSWKAKVAASEKVWALRAKEINAGTREHVWDIINERGLVKDVAGRPELIRKIILEKRIGAYAGIDPTFESLHVGHLLPLMPLFWMYFYGMSTTTLLGGATARMGDPTGRLKSREIMSNADISKNILKVHYQLKKIWHNVEHIGRKYGYEGEWAGRPHLRNNNMWLNKLPLYEFLKLLGRHTRIGPMLSRETVKRKMTEGDGMSFAEFTYPLLQGWDFWHLYSVNGVQMQIGGSDQYGNIVAGIDIVKTLRASEPAPHFKIPDDWTREPVGFTVPLLTDSAGNKFGKSAGNGVWLDGTLTAPFAFYGYFVNRPDDQMESLLKLFTFLPLDDVKRVIKIHQQDVTKRFAQHILAFEVTSIVHGPEVALREQMQHQLAFNKPPLEMPRNLITAAHGVKLPSAIVGDRGDGESSALPTTANEATQETIKLPRGLVCGKSISRVLYACGLADSTSEGTRLIQAGGAYVAAQPGPDFQRLIPGNLDWTPVKTWFPEDTKRFVLDDKLLILRKGKYNVRIIEIVSDDEWAASGKTYRGEPYTGKLRQLREAMKVEKAAERSTRTADDEDVEEAPEAPRGEWQQKPTKPVKTVSNNPDIHFPAGPKKGSR